MARRVVCKNQMKQIGLAFSIYETENDDKLPQSIDGNPANVEDALNKTWWGLLGPSLGLESGSMKDMDRFREASVGTVGNCPSHGKISKDPAAGGKESFSYCANANLVTRWSQDNGSLGGASLNPVKSASIRRPHSKVLVYEIFHAADWPLAQFGNWRGSYHTGLERNSPGLLAYDAYGELEGAGWGPTHMDSLNYLFADGSVDSVDHMEKMLDGHFKP
ncbi:DUF1559 domain-containing protein [Sedimentisphaera salicampi]|nr:DUF1559 domain-containing protein [Sedimentisphaera salicampi]